MRLRSHWQREFGGGRFWLVALAGQLDFLAAWLAPLLDRPYLSPVPPAWLHLTLAPETIDAAAVRERCAPLTALDALVGPVRVVEEGLAAGVEPQAELQALYEAVGGEAELWPHVSFAYARADAELEQLEVNASDAVLIHTLSLVDLRRDGELYRWDVVDTVGLASPHEP